MLKISSTVVKATGSYVIEKAGEVLSEKKNDIENHAAKIKAAKEIITSMGELKGGLMKIGQMISVTEDLVLPKEITNLFKSLQKNSPAMKNEELFKVFIEDFGKSPFDLFESFEIIPIASASIGQVHKAKTKNGRIVAVKVQYPKIVNAIKSDLENIHQIDKLFNLILSKKIDITPVLEEIKSSLLSECDYELEANNLHHFRELYKDKFPEIIIPKVYTEYSSKRILTLEFFDGDHFDDTLNYSKEQKDHLGKVLYESFLYSLFEHGVLHTDPQDGNYLFKENKIIILDFGSVKFFPNDFIENYAILCRSIEANDLSLFRYASENLGVIQDIDGDDKIRETFDLVKTIYSPFLKEGSFPIEKLNPFQLVKEFITNIENISDRKVPKTEFILLDRANIGLFTKLKKWQSHVNWRDGKRRYQDDIEKATIKKLVENSIISDDYLKICN